MDMETPMNDQKTAAQHNAPQTGEAYSTPLSDADLQGIRNRLVTAAVRYHTSVGKADVERLLAERKELVQDLAAIAQWLKTEYATAEPSGDVVADFGTFLEHHKQVERERNALVKEIADLKNLDLGHRLEAFGLADENILPACNCLNEAPTYPTFRDNPHSEKCRVRRIWEATVNVCAIGQKGLAAMDDKRKAAEKERDTLREQVTKLREALQYIGGKTDHGHEGTIAPCRICRTVDKALAETEAQ